MSWDRTLGGDDGLERAGPGERVEEHQTQRQDPDLDPPGRDAEPPQKKYEVATPATVSVIVNRENTGDSTW
jgi:hypothetical protein